MARVYHGATVGGVDPFLAKAVSLMQLLAGHNQLQGGIPDALATHPNLTTLDLSDNALDTLPSAWSSVDDLVSSQLSILKLAGNKYENQGFQKGYAHRLCRFSGAIPVGLAALPLLTRLNLASNNFQGDLPRIDGAPFAAMLFFNVSNNDLGGTIPSEYGQMRMFKQSGIGYVDSNNVVRPITFTFDVSNNQLTGDIPAFLNRTVRAFLQ